MPTDDGGAASAWEADRAALTAEYQRTLRETLFTNRSDVRPAMLRQIAAQEAGALLGYLQSAGSEAAARRGEHLCQIGLSEQTVLRLGQVARQFYINHLDRERVLGVWAAIDTYHNELVKAYVQAREKTILNEQELIRSALQRTLSRYTVQMEVAASVAAATTSILDQGELLKVAGDLIRERFDLYYVGIFLVDEQVEWAVLRAGTGEAGQELMRRGHRVEVGGASPVGRCVATGEAQIVLEVTKHSARVEAAYLPDTQSEVVIPLVLRSRVIGALNVHSQRVAAFSDQDVTILRILADQLANAIENARLFAELRRSEEKYRTILRSIEEGYFETDCDARFTFMNEATSHILGYPPDEILGRAYTAFSTGEHIEYLTMAFTKVLRTGHPANAVEFQVLRGDEPGPFVETSIALVRDAEGRPLGFRGILRDVTRRKQAEQLLIERKALERSNRELEQFAYVASHDLQEPLRKIRTFGDRLQTKHSTDLPDEARDYLNRMINATTRMQVLIDDLLALSRIATKAQPFTPVNLSNVAREVMADLETRIEQTGAQLEVGSLATIEADALQMRQLLQNLIGNALKFHRPDVPPFIRIAGRTLRERRITRGLSGDELYQITVEDNGIGFDEKYVDRIFQPFQRLHGREAYEGTGIGLTICQRIAERHGGRISARSTPGQGATFIVTLPVRHMKGENQE